MLLCRRRARFSTTAALVVAALALVAALGAGCDSGGQPGRPAPPAPPSPPPDAGVPGLAVARDGGARLPLAERYYRAYLTETVDGDRAAARAGYEAVLEAGAEDRLVAARAALRLAGMDAQEGRSRTALELVARADALGGDDPGVLEAVDALRLQLAGSGPRPDTGLRGPAVGTELDGVVATTAARRFAAAERLLDVYQRLRVRARIEKFDEDRARKEGALRAAEEAYRLVVAVEDPVATAAAFFRIGSLHHDYALLVLTLETPPELEPAYAAPVRRDLRNRAQRNFKDAQAAYAASLAAGADAAGAELWHAAARSGARAVEDMLR